MTTEQLNERLERERRKMLKDLGVENVDDAKKALADFKAKQEADKTEAQRNAEKLSELERVKAEVAELRADSAAQAASAMAGLTDEQREAVKAIAGDDPAAQNKTIRAMAKTWAKPATPATPATPAATTQAVTPPATTAPAAGSAPAQVTTPPTDHKAIYKDLEKRNPAQAANYLSRHLREIYPEQ